MAFFPEQEYKVSTKSEEELRKFTLEEDLSELQRSYILITKGSQLQKKAIYQNLHFILRDPKAFDNFFKVLREEVQQQEEEYQITCAQSMKRFLEEQRCSVNDIEISAQEANIMHILTLCWKILTIWSQPVLDAWYEVLEAALHKISIDLIWKDVQNLALSLSDATQPTVSRYISCRIIGSLAEIAKDRIKGPLFDKARILCQDPDIEIRKVMAEEVLLKICNNISTELLEVYMLEKILELVYDADISVKGGAVCTLFKVARNLSVEERKLRIVKIFYDLLVSPNEEMIKRMSGLSGPTFEILHPFISKNLQQHLQFLGIFREYGLNKNPAIRLNFAYNFPGVLSLAEPKRFDFFQDSYIKCLGNNAQPDVQRSLVCSFGEVVKIVSIEFVETLGAQFTSLMVSESEPILEKLVPRYQNILIQFAIKESQQHQAEENKDSKRDDTRDSGEGWLKLFTQFFDSSMEMLGYLQARNNWGLQCTFYEQFLGAQDHYQNGSFNCDAFQTQVQVSHYLQARQKSLIYASREVRRVCCLNIAKYLSWVPDLRRRNEILVMLSATLFDSTAYCLRIGYIDFIEGACQTFSRKFFLSNDFFKVLTLASDKVGTVIVRLAKIMPLLRMKITSEDEETLEQFEQALAVILKIRQKWIVESTHCLKKELEKLDIGDSDYGERDNALQKVEEDLYFNDLKARQEEDQQKDDFDINIRSDFVNEYLSKYRKRYTMFGSKIQMPKSKLLQSHSYNNLMGTKPNISKFQQITNDFSSKTIPVKKPFQYDVDVTPTGQKNGDLKKQTQSLQKQHLPNKSTDQKIPLIKGSPDQLKSALPSKKSDHTIQSFKLPSLTNNNKK